MRKPIVAGNWKMNLSIAESIALAMRLKERFYDFDEVEIVLCPPYTALDAVGKILQDCSVIKMGAQDIYPEDNGAYSGCVSLKMVQDVGCMWTIIGHSERRRLFGEEDDFINRKVRVALASCLKVMFCIGETLEERRTGQTKKVLERQITTGLQGVLQNQTNDLVIAYEPVWAIGTNETATPTMAEEAHKFVRNILGKLFGAPTANSMRIQYGGGVKQHSAADLFMQENIDGFLVGGASLEDDNFAGIVKSVLP
jgi:triosephosphate isomerase (TIM)